MFRLPHPAHLRMVREAMERAEKITIYISEKPTSSEGGEEDNTTTNTTTTGADK